MRKPSNKFVSDIELHILVCTNERQNKNKSCGKSGARILYKHLKDRMRAVGEKCSKIVKVNETSCLSNCSNGPVVVCYPDGDWFSMKTTRDVDVLIANLERRWLSEMRQSRQEKTSELPARPLYRPELGIEPKEYSH